MKINAFVAEFLGTMVLCFAGIGAIVAATMAKSPVLINAALAHGLAIAVAGTALGPISGGHFNPAVSLALTITRDISPVTMVTYWVAQLLGAFCGAALVSVTFPNYLIVETDLGTPILSQEVMTNQGVILEAVGTFILVMTVLGTAVDKRAPKMGALLIGLSITTMIFAFGPATGTGINPARWFGPSLVRQVFENPLVYVAGPLIGAALAAIIYLALFKEKDEATAS